VHEFEISLGETSTVDSPTALYEALVNQRKNEGTGGAHPLFFAEFTELLETGTLTKIPREDDEFLYREDRELARNDSDIEAENPNIPALEFRRLRRAFLYRRAKEKALTRIAHEKQIYTHSRQGEGKTTPTYSEYLGYLSSRHADTLGAFFRPWALPVSSRDLKAHAYIAARSGHGKSELIKTMLYGLLKARQGVILFDPHGDIAEQVARWKEWSDNPEHLIYFSPYLAGDSLDTVPVINPLAPLHDARDLDSAVENFIGVISAVVGGDFDMSVRMKMLLRPCLYTLAKYPDTTIYDLIEFMAESPTGDDKKPQATPWIDRAKKDLTNRAQHDILRTFFDKTYDTTKAAIRDRLRTFLASHGLDRCLAGRSTIDLAKAMDSGKFIIFNLARGKLGDETSATFGRFLLAAIQNTAMQRQEQNADERRPVFTFIDEADRLLSESVVSIYKETRKYGLHLAIAQQITGYGMTESMRRAVFGNSNVRIAGAGGGDVDTTRDLSNLTGVARAEIEALPPYVFYAKRGSGEAVRFTVPSLLTGEKNTMTATEWEVVKAYQIERYYTPADGSRPHRETRKVELTATPKEGRKPLHFN
jgi:hypothetical protein